jgi:hypothetical protein
MDVDLVTIDPSRSAAMQGRNETLSRRAQAAEYAAELCLASWRSLWIRMTDDRFYRPEANDAA